MLASRVRPRDLTPCPLSHQERGGPESRPGMRGRRVAQRRTGWFMVPPPRAGEEVRGIGLEVASFSGRVAGAVALLLGVAFHTKLDETVEQLRIGDTTGLPELRIHADLGEAGHGVDLVQIELA